MFLLTALHFDFVILTCVQCILPGCQDYSTTWYIEDYLPQQEHASTTETVWNLRHCASRPKHR